MIPFFLIWVFFTGNLHLTELKIFDLYISSQWAHLQLQTLEPCTPSLGFFAWCLAFVPICFRGILPTKDWRDPWQQWQQPEVPGNTEFKKGALQNFPYDICEIGRVQEVSFLTDLPHWLHMSLYI